MTTFSELGLDPALLKALETEGYTKPTPIQVQAIPSVLAGKDLLGIAQTGTGKTAAFALPILHRLAADRKPALRNSARVLVLSPTRELASQIAESFKTYGRHLGFTVATVFGGVSYKPQTQALTRGVDILVATPGRLIDHMNERNLNLGSTEILVLDEADQMMDLGFIRPLRQIISKLPSRRQSMFFSATMPHEIGALAAELLRDPVKVAVSPMAKTVDRVIQQVIFVEAPKKRALLVELMADPTMSRALVFTRTKRGADKVARHLEGAGIAVSAIHGNKSQGQREAALAAFKASKIRALIATDIAARGIDIDLVSHVINYELPNIPESYVHRIGRTARAGADGTAVSFCDGEERAYLRDIERLTRQTIPSLDRRGDTTLAVPADDRGAKERPERPHGGRGGPKRDRNGGGRPFERSTRGGERRDGGGAARPARDRNQGSDERRYRPTSPEEHASMAASRREGGDRPERPERKFDAPQGANPHRPGGRPEATRDHTKGHTHTRGDRHDARAKAPDQRSPGGNGHHSSRGEGDLRKVGFLNDKRGPSSGGAHRPPGGEQRRDKPGEKRQGRPSAPGRGREGGRDQGRDHNRQRGRAE